MAPKNKNPPPDDDENEGGFNDQQLQQLTGLITNTVNATVTAQLQRKLDGAIKTQIEGPMTEIRDLLSGLKPTGGTGEPPNPPPAQGSGGAGSGSNDPHPEVVQMRKRMEAIESERKIERENSRRDKRDSTLTQLVTAAGVDKNRVRGAVKLLADSVVIDEKTGAMTMKVQRQGFEDDADLDAGVAEWMKSDEGKSYLAPTQGPQRGGGGPRTNASSVVGGGLGRSAPGSSNAPARDPKQAKADRKANALESLSQGIGELLDGGNIDIG